MDIFFKALRVVIYIFFFLSLLTGVAMTFSGFYSLLDPDEYTTLRYVRVCLIGGLIIASSGFIVVWKIKELFDQTIRDFLLLFIVVLLFIAINSALAIEWHEATKHFPVTFE